MDGRERERKAEIGELAVMLSTSIQGKGGTRERERQEQARLTS